GNNDGRPMRNVTGISGAAPIWKAFMEAVIADPVLLRSLDAPEEPTAWVFTPPVDAVRIEQPCPRELRCPPQGEFFTRAWIEAHLLDGPYFDAYQSGLFSRVSVERTDGQRVQLGVCLQQRTAANDPDARTALMLPRGFGDLAPGWRYVDTLADLETPLTPEEAAPLLAGTLDLGLRPFLPTPGAQRPAAFAFAPRALEEQRAALRWASGRSTLLSLGTCAEAEGIVRAIYGERVRRIAISEPPRALASASNVLTATETITATEIAAAVAEPTPINMVNSETYLLASVNTDNNCPGNYVMGRVLDRNGVAIAGVAVQMVDQWGNRATAFTKGDPDAGMFDLPIYSGSQLELSLTVLGADGSPASPTVTLRYPPEDGALRCYHLVWRDVQG
ncbi:MAG: hypothetical protein ACK4SA_14590, partial [Caldilinea sp.]